MICLIFFIISVYLLCSSSRGAASDSAVLSYSHQDWVEDGPESGRLSEGQNYAFFNDASYNEMVIDGALRIVEWSLKKTILLHSAGAKRAFDRNSFRELHLPYTRGQVIETQSISRASILACEEVEFLLETIKNY